MECVLNYCSKSLTGEFLVLGAYGAAVLITVILGVVARSKSIREAATLVALSWVFGVFAFFYFRMEGYFMFAVMLDAILAHHFWRMAKVELFPAPLCIALLIEIAFIAFATSVGLSDYATIFILNRLFELILLYLIGCAIFRIYILQLRSRRDDARSER